MARDEDDRKALGHRLAAARTLAGKTQPQVADWLTGEGYPVGKAAVSAWEKGRNVPDALILRRLAKYYATTADALLWDTALSMEAVRFAAQFDGLTNEQQRLFRGMWMGFFEQAKSDDEVAGHGAFGNAPRYVHGVSPDRRGTVMPPDQSQPPDRLLGGTSQFGELDEDRPATKRKRG